MTNEEIVRELRAAADHLERTGCLDRSTRYIVDDGEESHSEPYPPVDWLAPSDSDNCALFIMLPLRYGSRNLERSVHGNA